MSKKHFKRRDTVDNMNKAGLNGYFYNFSAAYDIIAVDDILDIHNY